MPEQEIAGYVQHWTRRDCFFADKQSIVAAPKHSMLILDSDWKENFNFPIGPVQTAPEWRARARVCVSMMTTFVLGGKCFSGGSGMFISALSRINDKGALTTLAIMEDTLEYLCSIDAFDGVDEVVWFTDGGPHFSCKLVISTMATRWAERLRKANGSHLVVTGDSNYGRIDLKKKTGVEYHSKDSEDRYFSRADEEVKAAAKKYCVHSVKQAVDILTEMAARTGPTGLNKFDHREVVTDWLPSMCKEDWREELQLAKTLPGKVKGTHQWEMHVNDRRRKELLGKGNQLTAVDIRARCIAGVGWSDIHHPVMVPIKDATDSEYSSDSSDSDKSEKAGSEEDSKAEPAAPGPDEDSITCSNDIPSHWKKNRGYKVSYRTETPEVANRKTMSEHLQRRLGEVNVKHLEQGQRIMKYSAEYYELRAAARAHQKDRARKIRLKFKAERDVARQGD